MAKGSSRLLFFYSVLPFFATLTLATDPYFRSHCIETAGNYTANSTYQANLNSIFSQLTSLTHFNYGFHNLSAGRNDTKVDAIALCRGDRYQDECNRCFNDTISELRTRCPFYKEAIGWSQYCMLRYANRDIFGEMKVSPYGCVLNVQYERNLQFDQALDNLLNNLSSRAATGGPLRKFAAGNSSVTFYRTVYALVQCSPDLSEQECGDCLAKAKQGIEDCCSNYKGCRVYMPSCLLRFETDLFYQTPIALPPPPPPPSPTPAPSPSPPTPATGGKGNSTTRIVIIVVASVVGVLLLITSVCIFRRARKTRATLGTDDEVIPAESLQFDFATIRVATSNFSDANKLGQGGFGAVYKGRLLNGQEVAVKRLSGDSRQGDDEFMNEVLLVAKLQHRNLVRLRGFCSEGHEKLLIYEFVPNKSLDHFIFDPVMRAQLDWEGRYKIIGGIARGLLYFHKDSRLRIVHWDLKASNVLLDIGMIPKITDFGLARLFVWDETQGNTSRIVGTYEYMAPEYAMHELFSVKSNVFNFGVLILEIVSDQRNNPFRNGESVEDLVSCVWKNWRQGTAMNLSDPTLGGGSRNEVLRCIHIGLLCVQENIADRPTMAKVILMLNSFSITIPVPSAPSSFMHKSDMSSSYGYESQATKSDQSKSGTFPLSINEASITDLHPR